MEIENHLFDIKINGYVPIWDLVRFHLYYKYTWPPEKKNSLNGLKRICTSVENLLMMLSSFPFMFTNRNANLIFTNSRDYDPNGSLFDKSCENVINVLKNDINIIESRKAFCRYKYKSEYNYVPFVSKLMRSSQKFPVHLYENLNQILIKELGESKLNYEEINSLYFRFIKEYKLYRLLFRIKKVKRIFFVQNGIQKGMLAAAHSLGIQTFELQHGSFNKNHLAYSYPPSLIDYKNIIISNYFLTFGNYWNSISNIPSKVISIGNDAYISKLKDVEGDNSILFISSMIHGDELSIIAKKLSDAYPNTLIKFKLHQNEYIDENKYTNTFSNYKNIQVLKNKIDLNELIAKSSLIVLIASTVLYEALNINKKIAIYKRVNYQSQQDVFKLPNVYLFDEIEELIPFINSSIEKSPITFFESFNNELFKYLLKNTEI